MTFTPSMVFSQPNFERVLRQRVHNLPSVQVNLGTRVLGLQPIKEGGTNVGVTLTVAPTDDAQHHGQMGSLHQVQARFVVGCDGASSLVRQSVGIELEDLDFDEPWLVVDVLVNEQGLAKLPKVSVQYCEPERPSTYLIVTQNHRRWELSINPGEDPKQVATPEGTWKLLSRWLQPHEGTLWRQASYRFHALVAERFHSGRVFLAGDAAHQQPPFLGQGMCQGVRDAVNLSWKLGAVLNGQASNALLDTYSQERKAHVKELTSRIKGIGQLVGERNLDKARERDRKLLAECGGVVKPMPRQNVQPALAQGCLDPAASAGTGATSPAGAGTCAKCHVVDGAGKGVGPNLSGVGAKLSREALYESVLAPSAAISHSYETWTAVCNDGRSVTGMLISRTPQEVVIRGADAVDVTIPAREVEDLVKQPVSLMPADLAATLTADELVHVVSWMETLRAMQ
jgi:3-(3-hydroxy-phenyl)propionate hydroxylase